MAEAMAIDSIEAAIGAHMAWVDRFRDALSSSERESFDPRLVADDTQCELGRWLYGGEAVSVLGEGFHGRITAMHGTFHAIAGEIAAQLNEQTIAVSSVALIGELANLSRQLVTQLQLAQRRAL